MKPARPDHVPADAKLDETGQEWEAGATDGAGRKVGEWRFWRLDGTVLATEDFGDGATRMTYRRFHPDGTESQSGEKDLARDRWVGVMRWHKLPVASVEDRYWPQGMPAAAATYEVEFDEAGHVATERTFDRSGARITRTGAPFPARPAGVPDRATLVDDDTRWLVTARNFESTVFYGEYRAWDRNGTVVEHRIYSDAGALKREESYENGALRSAKDHDGDAMTASYYRTRDGKTVLHSSTLYRNNQNDRRNTRYDKTGAPVFSVRMEEVAPGHVRRYDDDVLVCEAKWTADGSEAPQVTYYDHGTVLVDYRSHGDGTGTFTLYHPDGTVEASSTIDDEADRNKYGNWIRLLPGFAHYEADREQTDVEFVRTRFREAVDQARFDAMVASVKIPPALSAIADIEWSKSRSAYRKAKLDKLLVVMLSDDKAMAQRAREQIWIAIEQQDCLFDATYDVAVTLARVASLLEGAPQVRAIRELADITCLAGMPHEQPKRYPQVIAAVRRELAVLEAFAYAHDDDDGRAVLHLLALLNAPDVPRARVRDTAASPQTRAFAGCALGACRDQTAAQRAAALATLGEAFAADSDPGVKVVLGVIANLVRGERGPRDAAIDDLLLGYILAPARQAEVYDAWRPVIRFLGDDVPSTLFRAVPAEVRLRHIELVVDGLPKRNILDQVTDLDMIFTTLFADGVETELTPLHQKALRNAAAVVDANPGFVNHAEIFRKHELPWDSFALRELANQAKPTPKAKTTATAKTTRAKSTAKAKTTKPKATKAKAKPNPKPTKPTKSKPKSKAKTKAKAKTKPEARSKATKPESKARPRSTKARR